MCRDYFNRPYPLTLPYILAHSYVVLKKCLQSVPHHTIAVQALAQGWHDEDDIVKILKDRTENDENEHVRRATAQAMRHYGIK